MKTLPGLEGYESSCSSSSSSSSSSSTENATEILKFDVTTKGENEQATTPKQDGPRVSTTNDSLSEALQKNTGSESESECSSVSDDESSCDDLSTDIEAVKALIRSNAVASEEDEDEGCMEAPRTKNEIVVAPIEPTPLDVDIEGRELSIAGNIISVIMSEGSVVVMSAPGLAPLDEDTVLCCTKADKDGKHDASCVIGCISEVFGPVSRPHYFIPCNPERLSELKDAGFLLEPGSQVMSVGGMTSYLSQETLLAQRSGGCDASDAFDEELPPDQVEFSDDEKEMIAKGGRRKKRGGNGNIKEGWGGGKDSGHKERGQSSKSCFDSRVHPQHRLQEMMMPLPNYPSNLQHQAPFSQFQQYNREQPCRFPQHSWMATRQREGVIPPIQQEVGPNNFQWQNEISGHHHEQFQQIMNQHQHLPTLQPQWLQHQSILRAPQQQPQPMHFNQASNQSAMWHGGLPQPSRPAQPPSLPSTPYHALNLVPSSSYHDTHRREGGHNLNPPSPQEPEGRVG